jgi:hypothetical protein
MISAGDSKLSPWPRAHAYPPTTTGYPRRRLKPRNLSLPRRRGENHEGGAIHLRRKRKQSIISIASRRSFVRSFVRRAHSSLVTSHTNQPSAHGRREKGSPVVAPTTHREQGLRVNGEGEGEGLAGERLWAERKRTRTRKRGVWMYGRSQIASASCPCASLPPRTFTEDFECGRRTHTAPSLPPLSLHIRHMPCELSLPHLQ